MLGRNKRCAFGRVEHRCFHAVLKGQQIQLDIDGVTDTMRYLPLVACLAHVCIYCIGAPLEKGISTVKTSCLCA